MSEKLPVVTARQLVRWYAEGNDRMTPEDRDQKPLRLIFLRHRDLLAAEKDPVAALRGYLAEQAAEDREYAASDA